MLKSSLRFVIIGLLLAVAAAAEGNWKPYSLDGPQIMLPPKITVKKKVPIDFDLFFFTKAKHQVLFAYVGDAPSFPMEAPKNMIPQQETIHGMATTTYRWKGAQGKLCRESLLETSRSDFAGKIHYVYTGLSGDEAKLSDAMIASTRPSAN